MNCPKCGIEHSKSWTCAQALANLEASITCTEPGDALSEEWQPVEVPKKISQSERMKAWWATQRLLKQRT